jgi:hypothetical protein
VLKENSLVCLTAVRQSPPTTSTLRSFDAGDSTRARDYLLVTDVTPASEFLNDLRMEHTATN